MKSKLSMHIGAAILLCTQVIQSQTKFDHQVGSLDIYNSEDIRLTQINELSENEGTIIKNRNSESVNHLYKFELTYNFDTKKNLTLKTGFRFSNPRYTVLQSENIEVDIGIKNNNMFQMLPNRSSSWVYNNFMYLLLAGISFFALGLLLKNEGKITST